MGRNFSGKNMLSPINFVSVWEKKAKFLACLKNIWQPFLRGMVCHEAKKYT